MVEDVYNWPRVDLGGDMEKWTWAMEQVKHGTDIPLATRSAEGPRVRPVTAVPHGGRLYVLTGTKDAKVMHLTEDPRFEFYVLVKKEERIGYVRFQGEARFVEDPDVRREVSDASGFAEQYFKGPDDPNLTLLWLDVREAEILRPGMQGYELLTSPPP